MQEIIVLRFNLNEVKTIFGNKKAQIGSIFCRKSLYLVHSALQISKVKIYYTEAETAVEAVESQKSKTESKKIIRDGQILIIKNGKTFNALGAEMR